MGDVQQTVSTPEGASKLANAIKDLVVGVIRNHAAAKATGQGAVFEVSADVTELVKDLGPALQSVGLLKDESKVDIVGVIEAFSIAGCELGRQLHRDAAAPAAPAVASS